MSHKVVVDFESLSISIQSQCEVAMHSMCKIDKTIERIHKTASKLESSKVVEYENYLLKSKKTIQTQIDAFINSLNKYKAFKTKTFDEDVRYGNEDSKALARMHAEIKKQRDELINTVNELTGAKLEIIDQMISEGLLNAGEAVVQKLLDKASGRLNVSEDLISKINLIEDVSLRELAYRELVNAKNETPDYETIIANAQEEYDILLGKKTRSVIEEYKEELKANGIASDIINNVTTIDEANKVFNAAITDEKIRKETLKVIIKAIKDRGFIVDTKKNLKIDREKNIVKLVALKASGQTAEFEIQINGKFMYHFEGYEGLACNKDITPFIEDLKKVYDINILHEEVQWSNPDKIATQKYQYINKNKGTN